MADTTVSTSKQFTLNLNDFWKGLIVAALTAPITVIMNSLQAGNFTIDWKNIGLMALTGLIGYLIKNFFTPAQTIIKPAPEAGTMVTVDIPKPGDTTTAAPK